MFDPNVAQLQRYNLMKIKQKVAIDEINQEVEKIATSLNEIKELWPKTKENLIANWIDTVEKLKTLSKEQIDIIVTNILSRSHIYTFLWIKE